MYVNVKKKLKSFSCAGSMLCLIAVFYITGKWCIVWVVELLKVLCLLMKEYVKFLLILINPLIETYIVWFGGGIQILWRQV